MLEPLFSGAVELKLPSEVVESPLQPLMAAAQKTAAKNSANNLLNIFLLLSIIKKFMSTAVRRQQQINVSALYGTDHDAFVKIFLQERIDDQKRRNAYDDKCVF